MNNPSSQHIHHATPPDLIQESQEGIYLRMYVRPGSKVSKILGYHGNAVRISIRAVPERGQANLALESFLATELGISPNQVRITSGHTARMKRVLIQGVLANTLIAWLKKSLEKPI